MTMSEREPQLSDRMKDAIGELEGLILERYPAATFRVVSSPDEEHVVHVLATVDVEDRDKVVDLYVERMSELQIAEGLPLLIVPVRSHEMNERLLAKRRSELHTATDVPQDLILRLPQSP